MNQCNQAHATSSVLSRANFENASNKLPRAPAFQTSAKLHPAFDTFARQWHAPEVYWLIFLNERALVGLITSKMTYWSQPQLTNIEIKLSRTNQTNHSNSVCLFRVLQHSVTSLCELWTRLISASIMSTTSQLPSSVLESVIWE